MIKLHKFRRAVRAALAMLTMLALYGALPGSVAMSRGMSKAGIALVASNTLQQTFSGNCALLFACSLQTPERVVLPKAAIVPITPASAFTATIFITNVVSNTTADFGDLTGLSIKLGSESRFAEQRRTDSYYVLDVSMPDLPLGDHPLLIEFAMTSVNNVKYTFTDTVTFRVTAKVTPTPLPTMTPTLLPTATLAPTRTPIPNARPYYLPVVNSDPCGAFGPPDCDEPNGNRESARPRLQVGRVITTQVGLPTDEYDFYRILIPDALPYQLALDAIGPGAGVDLDLTVWDAVGTEPLCRSVFTGRNNERIRFNVLPCSESATARTTRLPPGVYFVSVRAAAAPAGTPVPYTIALRAE